MTHRELIEVLDSIGISMIQSKREKLLDFINDNLEAAYERGQSDERGGTVDNTYSVRYRNDGLKRCIVCGKEIPYTESILAGKAP